jgi:hypothetical protein
MVARRSSSIVSSYDRTERSDQSASRSKSNSRKSAPDGRQTIETTSPFRRPPRKPARSDDRSERSEGSASIPKSISLSDSKTHMGETEPLPENYWKRLEELKFHYPGWERDYTHACEAYHLGDEMTFVKSFRKLRDKQRVYDDYRAFSRLNELAALNLSYPGCENDQESLELWHLKNPSTEANDMIFQDKLNGLRNKESLYFGDRSHPNIVALDELELSYSGWEDDYQAAVGAHCDCPERKFEAIYHRLEEKQRIQDGDRFHWRLAALDRLSRTLTYLGWERDVADVENWHIDSLDTDRNGRMFAEVLEGMKDQQQIFMGWNHEGGEESDGTQSGSDESLDAKGNFYKLDLKGAKDLRECYDSISQSLQAHEGKKKQLVEQRSASPAVSRSSTPVARRSPSPTGRDASSYNGRDSPTASYQGRASPASYQSRSSAPVSRARTSSFQSRTSASSGRASPARTTASNDRLPPKQVKFGNCVMCLSRPKTHVFVPCGHLCACAACSSQAMESNQGCPICRRQADFSYRVFM